MKINFRPDIEYALEPVPAVSKLPNWYKKMLPYFDGRNKQKTYPDGTKNITIKRCNPFGDALGAGYFILLDQDIEVEKKDETHSFVWLTGGEDTISIHGQSQIDSEMIPVGFSPQPYKFKNRWGIQTPKGFSVLITHPLNRAELPFYTLSGIVDTDNYSQVVELPFLLRSDFEGILEAGTPIAQIIPLKRQSWHKQIFQFDNTYFQSKKKEFERIITRAYKRFYWVKKEYK
jgi:hypothetical protein